MNNINVLLIALISLLFTQCDNNSKQKQKSDYQQDTLAVKKEDVKPEQLIDIQGHRGCRGLMPENTIPAFLKALALGITTLELDVVVTKDKKVVISHEPWLSAEICKDMWGKDVQEAKEPNIYKMTYAQLSKCDCGSRTPANFPKQRKTIANKPLLTELIDTIAIWCEANNIDKYKIHYNIEIKRKPEHDRIFNPPVEEFVDLVLADIKAKKIEDQCNIQSFDWEVLQITKEKAPNIMLAMLVENELSPQENLDSLGFTPEIYSCYFKLIDNELLEFVQKNNMKLIPWTVNEPQDIERMFQLPINGIITDYPDRVLKMIKEKGKKK